MKNDKQLIAEAYTKRVLKEDSAVLQFTDRQRDGEIYYNSFSGEVIVDGAPYYVEGEIHRDVQDDSDYDRETGYGEYKYPGEHMTIAINPIMLEDIPDSIAIKIEAEVLKQFQESGRA